jgi:predicted ArsR family transcriptional regulator
MNKKELLINLLKNNKKGLTIKELSRELKISRNTVPVILAELKGAKLIQIKHIGKAKLHFWKRKKRPFRRIINKSKKEVIKKILKQNPGLTVIEISRILRISRNTAPKILVELEKEGLIKIRNVGRAKLHYLK